MRRDLLGHIQVLPKAGSSVFEQRESGITHTSYAEETAFFALVERGEADMVKQSINRQLASYIVVGRLSDNNVRQIQYWAVCCVTLAIRSAIRGGLDEMQAFNCSDRYIMQIDRLNRPEEIMDFLEKAVLELTGLVREQANRDCPVPIRKCLCYIDRNLHRAIRLPELAALTHFSEDYLSRLFKKHVGKTIRDYILEKKLEEAKTLLRGEADQKLLAYYLGFCSQSYFITRFKKAYGMTPRQYAMSPRGGS